MEKEKEGRLVKTQAGHCGNLHQMALFLVSLTDLGPCGPPVILNLRNLRLGICSSPYD